MADRTVHALITGLVQGVSFRVFVEREALALGLSGWVRNRRDDRSVEAVFAGRTEAVEDMIKLCRKGPPGATVAEVRVAEHEEPVAPGFRLRPTV